MSSSVKEELDKIQRRAVSGDFLTSYDELEELLKSDDLTLEEELYIKVIQSEVIQGLVMMDLDEYSIEEAIRIAEEVVQYLENTEDEYLQVSAFMSLGVSYIATSEWKKAFEVYEKFRYDFPKLEPNDGIFYLRLKATYYLFESIMPTFKTYINEISTDEEKAKGFQAAIDGEKFCEKHNLVSYQVAHLLNLGSFQHWMGDMDASLKTRIKMVDIAKKAGNKLFYTYTLNILSGVYFTLSDYRKYYDLQKEILVIVEELKIKSRIAGTYNNIGHYFLVSGDYDEAISCYNKSIKIREELKREIGVAFLQKECGYAYFLKGDFENAIAYYDKAYPILEKTKPQGWRFILSDLAALHIQTGEYDRALNYLEQLMPIHEGLNDQHGISMVLSDQGMIYWQRGMKDKGLELIEQSLEMRKKLGDKAREAASLSYLIQFHIEQNNIQKAKEYFEHLDQINQEIDNKHVNQNHKFSEALILKSSDNERDRIKAELLFEQLIQEEPIYPVLVQVLLNLCELLIISLRETSNEEILDRLNNHVQNLQEISEKNKSPILHIETLGLKAKLALVDFDTEKSNALLSEAQSLAQENGLDSQVLNILKQQEELTKMSIEMKKLELEKSSISSRLSAVKLETTVEKMKTTNLSKTVSKEEVSKKLFSLQI